MRVRKRECGTVGKKMESREVGTEVWEGARNGESGDKGGVEIRGRAEREGGTVEKGGRGRKGKGGMGKV